MAARTSNKKGSNKNNGKKKVSGRRGTPTRQENQTDIAGIIGIVLFCLGILLCRLYRSKTGLAWGERIKESNTVVVTLCELCLVVLLILSFFAYESMTLRLRCAALFWLVIPPILLFFTISDKHGGYITRLLRHYVLLWCASVSLEIFLVHMLVLRVVDSLMATVGIAQGVLTATMGLIVMFPVAWLTKRFFVDKIYVSLIKYVE